MNFRHSENVVIPIKRYVKRLIYVIQNCILKYSDLGPIPSIYGRRGDEGGMGAPGGMADDCSSKDVCKLRNHISSFFPLVTNDPTVATSSVVDFVTASFPPSPLPRRAAAGSLYGILSSLRRRSRSSNSSSRSHICRAAYRWRRSPSSSSVCRSGS